MHGRIPRSVVAAGIGAAEYAEHLRVGEEYCTRDGHDGSRWVPGSMMCDEQNSMCRACRSVRERARDTARRARMFTKRSA